MIMGVSSIFLEEGEIFVGYVMRRKGMGMSWVKEKTMLKVMDDEVGRGRG